MLGGYPCIDFPPLIDFEQFMDTMTKEEIHAWIHEGCLTNEL